MKVRNYTAKVTLCDECEKKLRNHFDLESEWTEFDPNQGYFEGKCDLCGKIKQTKAFEYLPL